ncbi:acyl--CoA ligase family protein [Nonomuraea sp. NPDC048826]|uniref:acyl--CoA ligase family protein n=1 Tax=Nonomuraea sp. NPDC048826 TaxID=3364347 RepID=UPI0037235406
MAPFTFTPLTPSAFLERSGTVFRDRIAVIDGTRRFTYGEFLDRARRLTGALADLGVGPGDRVAALCVNSHVMLELHNGVPMRGAVLVPLNIRLSAGELAHIVEHSGARVLVATAELAVRAREVAAATGVRLVVADGPEDAYERLLAAAEPRPVACEDERGLLAINYTSGTTGLPKGVMYHHRGAYLQTLAMAFHAGLGPASAYLWTLPMFHCDGWCFTWAVTAAGGTHVCLRAVDPAEIWRLLREEDVSHFSAAPTVLTMIANAPEARAGEPLAHTVRVQTGGAPPTPTLLARMAGLRMEVTHLYGLTETFGPVAVNQWQPQWDALPAREQAELKARQGVGNVIAERVRVLDGSGADVPADGETVGEIVVRGNDAMLGYYRDERATAEVDAGGWLRTGDLAVRHPDGYLEIRDRSKDIIISGGENIASVEVERVLDGHPDVLESAVVGVPDEKWGQVPVAFVALRPEAGPVSEDDIVAYVRERIARFKAPRKVIFGELPKTSTGKIQKNVLRASGERL